jgi:hypothetical protein
VNSTVLDMFGDIASVGTAARAHRWLTTSPVPSTYKSNGIDHRPPGDTT